MFYIGQFNTKFPILIFILLFVFCIRSL